MDKPPTYLLGFGVFALLLNGCGEQQAAATPTIIPTETPELAPVRELKSVECRTPSLIEMECYDLLVPQDRSNSNSKTIRLHVALFKSSTSAADPILFLSGGPGDPGIASVARLRSYSGFARSNRDVIVFDQRGTGESQPNLVCPEVDQFYIDTLDQSLNGNKLLAQWLKCRERLVSEGIKLEHYNSAASAADAEDLRRALEIEKWNLFGISYGTRLALTIMRDYPQGIRSAVLDSVYPLPETLEGYDYEDFRGKGSIPYLLDRCAADFKCNTAYPELENTLANLIVNLNENPVNIGPAPDVMLTGDRLLQILFRMMYSVDAIPHVPQLIKEAANGDFELVSRYASWVLPSVESGGMNLSVSCVDNASLDIHLPMINSPTELEEILLDGIEAGVNESSERCEAWLSTPIDTAQRSAFASDIPTLLIVGEFDPATPVWYAELAKQTLPNSYLYEFQGFGHFLTGSDANANGCVGKLMVSFWNEPTARPDDGCFADLRPRKFITE